MSIKFLHNEDTSFPITIDSQPHGLTVYKLRKYGTDFHTFRTVPYRTREYGVPYRALVPYSCLVKTTATSSGSRQYTINYNRLCTEIISHYNVLQQEMTIHRIAQHPPVSKSISCFFYLTHLCLRPTLVFIHL